MESKWSSPEIVPGETCFVVQKTRQVRVGLVHEGLRTTLRYKTLFYSLVNKTRFFYWPFIFIFLISVVFIL